MNVYEKIAMITAELGVVAKNLNVSTSKNASYKAVSERDILDAVKPLEEKYRICSYPVRREVLESQMLESESSYGKKTTFFTRVMTIYRFVNADEPTEYVETTVFSEGIDSQDKGSGKAMTYADKYALMKMYKISTGDDPDQAASEDAQYRTHRKTVKCEACGKPIYPALGKNNEEISVDRILSIGQKKHGRNLCAQCQKDMADHEA